MTQKDKDRFRSSKEWREFRELKRKIDRVDYLSHSKLTTSYNLHHIDLSEENYTNISNIEHFVCLNKKSHDTVHFIYNIYRKDKEVLSRLKTLLDRMLEINERR